GFSCSARGSWTRPAKGKVKLSMDAALFPDVGFIGIGYIVCNLFGEVLAVSSHRVDLNLRSLNC
ncbi:hypothetical protein PanWU01x14_307610, partial [Parasponia andersonii]